MKRPSLGLLLALTATTTQAGSIRPPSPGRYCVYEQMFGETGTGRFPLGEFWMIVEVSAKNGVAYVAFDNALADHGRVLSIDAVPAGLGPDGVLRFTFVDGWENVGSGTLSPSGLFSLRMDREAPGGGETLRNYVSMTVTAEACRFAP